MCPAGTGERLRRKVASWAGLSRTAVSGDDAIKKFVARRRQSCGWVSASAPWDPWRPRPATN
ncbi:hypothetical protein GCM10022226_40320 [Sphaerisporangium flaviroseum]|uniref:Uncharacterized protein n=1 Tax=Sphaerisporangium flaviroseum TaxID=509199 RepID=A0ABP7ID79_9ACTN